MIAHLVESHYAGDLVAAVQVRTPSCDGHFAFAVVHRDHADEIVAARRQCPLVVGVGDGETFMASAIPAFLSRRGACSTCWTTRSWSPARAVRRS